MYPESVYQWNVFKGCLFDCVYCRNSFQRISKRFQPTIDKNGKQRGCQSCYDYKPHFHPERLNNSLKKTKSDQFIFCCSSGDIYFAEKSWINAILVKVRENSDKTFFFQSKAPECFFNYDFPENVILGITLESNQHYPDISKAPPPEKRAKDFSKLDFDRKHVTIEPVMEFDPKKLKLMIKSIDPEIINFGYDSKNSKLSEPEMEKSIEFVKDLRTEYIVKTKYMKGIEI